MRAAPNHLVLELEAAEDEVGDELGYGVEVGGEHELDHGKPPTHKCQLEAVRGKLGSRSTSAEIDDAVLASLLSVMAGGKVAEKKLVGKVRTPIARATNVEEN